MAIKQRSKSLKSRSNQLADTFYQLNVLQNGYDDFDGKPFRQSIQDVGYKDIRPLPIQVFQINITKLCNQSCAHCHVDAGPDRKDEMMSKKHLKLCLDIIKNHRIPIVDITGGAPELHPDFKWFVGACVQLGVQVINRCNLTIIMSNKKYHDLPKFFADHGVHLVSSLPYFSKSRTDRQRGDGVFEDSIQALKKLNHVGYGQVGTDLILDLVYNPSGAFLPGDQYQLEAEFKRQLKRKYDIVFNKLLAITNLPISRFLEYLIESGNYAEYMTALIQAFNPTTIDGLMCRNTISVSWQGNLYDCDFNQMLDLTVQSPHDHIERFDAKVLANRRIVIGQHCYGCTAGAGSSCGGEIQST